MTEVLGRDICANDPRMSAGCPPRKLPLWAAFSFLILGKGKRTIERPPPNPVLEASERGISLVCAHFL